MRNLPDSILQKLAERKKNQAFRTLMEGEGMIDFFSNDYLGLARWGTQSNLAKGSTGSRLISGNSLYATEIEKDLAVFFGMSSALFFNSGYDANLGIFSSIPQKGDTVVYDELVHASIRDGIRMSNANGFSFKHNDLDDLSLKLQRAKGAKYVAVESIYSMDGDQAPLIEIVKICNEYNAFLIVDEAHSGGIIGEKGEGLISMLNLNDEVFIKLITFGKAYGSHGALVLSSSDVRDYLINFARSLIYTTALPPETIERIYQVVHQASVMSDTREELNELINYFKEAAKDISFELLKSESPIQSIIIPGNESCKIMANKIVNQDVAVKAILSPTVSAGTERLRICLHSYNTKGEIDQLISILNGE
ncbi:aminotransferase class I/II-fold pyridoxal phosphate-dependent enzyme [Paracrocinitomix mangrovi]|uniref:aminotransferase class I/II-fold pyridoxal phosphate-dependent enzyme n=1 Tax=Paracrocinitomix mangrovi TaxID=2862509 RepID=UPI001C8EDDD1|nr:aminotransferase class I/II-fold pyridoxal phosphate-dependent enzyme [Paracrocinitomix mangrovi]UKN03025.1 aminotransferase class I/II-fold pyridoxal phosphate-dependent enzyme [Paracrocinitomix mangrovi]